MDATRLRRVLAEQERDGFTGAVLVRQAGALIAGHGFGLANRSEGIPNQMETRFGIASGAKFFTAIAINQLVDAGELTLDARLCDCLPFSFPHFDPAITIHHLLTHTAGVPDYFDEDVIEDYEELWVERPMYRMRRLEDFLPLFQDRPMQFGPGKRFKYNNTGYILLGLVLEQVTGQPFQDYVAEHVLARAGMTRSGYFELDALPSKTAQGHIELPNGRWKTNIYSVPAKGGADGGVYASVEDIANAWDALMQHRLLTPTSTACLLTPHVAADPEGWFYGYGVWIDRRDEEIFKYYLMGYDPGVNFHFAFFPAWEVLVVVCSNRTNGAYAMMKAIEDAVTIKS